MMCCSVMSFICPVVEKQRMPVRALRLSAIATQFHILYRVEKQRMPVRALRQQPPGRAISFSFFVEKQRMPVRALKRSTFCSNEPPDLCGKTKNARKGIETSFYWRKGRYGERAQIAWIRGPLDCCRLG